MDHDAVVRQQMTEKYLLNELDPKARDEFEEHYFDCPDCALDVRAGALFVERTKAVFAGQPAMAAPPRPVVVPAPSKPGWTDGLRAGLLGMFRPAFALPIMALLLAVIGYQNLVTYPHLQNQLNSPRVLPFASVNVGTYGSEGPVITTRPGEDFLIFVRIPPENSYSNYRAELYNPAGKVEWSLTIPATAGQDQWPVQVPASNWAAGNYTLAVRGVTTSGDSKDVGRASFELQIQK